MRLNAAVRKAPTTTYAVEPLVASWAALTLGADAGAKATE